MVATDAGFVPAGNAEPVTGISVPVIGSIVKAETSPDPWLATYTYWRETSTVADCGPMPADTTAPPVTSLPVSGVMTRSVPLFEPSLATHSNASPRAAA